MKSRSLRGVALGAAGAALLLGLALLALALLGGQESRDRDPSRQASPPPAAARAARSGLAGLRERLWGELPWEESLRLSPENVNSFGRAGFTPLDWAARAGRIDDIHRLIALGADLNLRDEGPNGWTALMHAVHTGQIEAVRTLLTAGAEVDRPAPNGTTALMIAAGQGEADIAEVLLAAGADPRRETRHGATALTNAVAEGDPATVRALLRHAPGLRLRGNFVDRAAAALALLRGRREVLRILDRAAGRLRSR